MGKKKKKATDGFFRAFLIVEEHSQRRKTCHRKVVGGKARIWKFPGEQ